MELDKYAKLAAVEHANNDAMLNGFPIKSEKWKKSYNEYMEYATSTMSVGRKNPRFQLNPIAFTELHYPDIFGPQGLAARLAAEYTSHEGKGVPPDVIKNRILAAVTSLVKIYENSVLGNVNTTKGHKQGLIDNNDMSQLQLPKKEGMSEDQYRIKKMQVMKHRVLRDLLTNLVLESLMPFFRLSAKDINDILNSMDFDSNTIENYNSPIQDEATAPSAQFPKGGSTKVSMRDKFIEKLHARMKPKFMAVSLRRMLIGRD